MIIWLVFLPSTRLYVPKEQRPNQIFFYLLLNCQHLAHSRASINIYSLSVVQLLRLQNWLYSKHNVTMGRADVNKSWGTGEGKAECVCWWYVVNGVYGKIQFKLQEQASINARSHKYWCQLLRQFLGIINSHHYCNYRYYFRLFLCYIILSYSLLGMYDYSNFIAAEIKASRGLKQ